MQKKFLFGGLVVALAVAYPAISYFHGSKLHTEVEQRVAKINEYLHDELALKSSLEAKLEQSGIFSSQYIIALKMMTVQKFLYCKVILSMVRFL